MRMGQERTMSWDVDIRAKDKSFSQKDVDRAVAAVGTRRGDVYPPEGKYLRVTGAGFSRGGAVEFCHELADELRKLGYEVTVSKLRD